MRAPQVRFDQLVQDFFLRRLIDQRGASARTVESYRDAFELLFGYIEQRLGKPASALNLADLDAPMILDFLDHLETVRHNSARTRNARLAAIHSFMRYAALRDPASLPITTRVLAIPSKRFDRPVLGYLTREQIAAILAAPDRTTWSGQSRCRAAHRRLQHRCPSLGTDRPSSPRRARGPPDRRAPARQRPQTASHPALGQHRRRTPCLAEKRSRPHPRLPSSRTATGRP